MNLDCLENLVGLIDASNDNCACLNVNKPANFSDLNESDSGFYLVSQESGAPLLSAILSGLNCEDAANIFTLLADIRKQAQAATLEMISAELRNLYAPRIQGGVSDEIGERKSTGVRQLSQAFAGVQIVPNRLKGFAFVVNKIYMGFEGTHSISLLVNSDNPDFGEWILPMNATANTWTENVLTTPIRLPFWGEAFFNDPTKGDRYSYNFSFRVNNERPLQNRFHCGCSGAKPGWSKHMDAAGYEAASPDNYGCFSATLSNGIVLSGYLTCDTMQWLCELDKNGGEYDLKQVLAKAIVYKSVELLCDHVLTTNKIGWTVYQDREGVYGKRANARKEFGDRVQFLAANIPRSANDCFTCKGQQWTMGSL